MVVFLFGLLVYLYFFWVFSGLILFAIHWQPYAGSYAPLISSVFPFSCDASGAGSLDLHSVLINLFVFVPFFLQHTIMARPWFKNNVAYKLLPFYLERSLFVLVASISMHFGLTHWNSSSPIFFQVKSTAVAGVLDLVSVIGFLIVLLSSFMIDHFDLFGLRQTWMRDQYTRPLFVEKAFYSIVRHPLMLGFIMGFSASSVFSVNRVILAAVMLTYIQIGLSFEEADLLQSVPEYREYAARVPRLCPLTRPEPKRKLA
jgi:protein-S-isoprenylcysteine O-methyltransferase Ste14